MDTLRPVVHGAQLVTSAYGLYASYISVTNVRQWEDQTKTAAQYSGIAGEQLHKTRTTLTVGTGALLMSTVSAINLALLPAHIPHWVLPPLVLANCVLTFAARYYVRDWWHGKAKVPLAQAYNTAISRTLEISNVLGVLSAMWAVSGVLLFSS